MTEPPLSSALISESGSTGAVGVTVGHSDHNGTGLLPLSEGLTPSHSLARGDPDG